MELTQTLKLIGFDEKQSAVYLACLQLGEDTAFNIAKLAKIKRPTTYIILQTLAERGLLSFRRTKKASLYSAASPRKLLDQLHQREKNLAAAIPNLMAIYNQKPNKPEIQLFEGKDGVIQIYSEAFEAMRNGTEVSFYGSIIEPIAQFADLLIEYKKILKARKATIKELLPITAESQQYAKEMLKLKNPNHQIRFFAKTLHCGSGDNVIFGNKVVFMPYYKNKYYIIVIENTDLVTTHKTLFEQAWKSALPLR